MAQDHDRDCNDHHSDNNIYDDHDGGEIAAIMMKTSTLRALYDATMSSA